MYLHVTLMTYGITDRYSHTQQPT